MVDVAYGRRPPKNAPALMLGPLLTTAALQGNIPSHPKAADNFASLRGGWLMLGNDVAGDCVSVTWANVRRVVTAVLTGREIYPSIEWVWELYKTQNPDFDPNGTADTNGPGSPSDQGMDIQTVLEYLVKVGGPDGVKAVAFAKVDHTDTQEVLAAVAVFGYVWTGINVSAANENEFGSDEPWDFVSSSPVIGGHSVVTGGYTGIANRDEAFITWAEETYFTDSFWARQVEEAWVVIWPEHLGSVSFLAGVDEAALATDYKTLTGKVLVLPTPPVQPPPLPVPPSPVPPVPVPPSPVPPSPDPADDGLAEVAKVFVAARHSASDNVRMASALKIWLAEKGL